MAPRGRARLEKPVARLRRADRLTRRALQHSEQAQACPADADGGQMMGISARRAAAAIVIAVVLISGAVFATATIERDSAVHSSDQQAAGHALLAAMLDEDTGARGYFETREVRFLAPWYRGRQEFATALAGE